MTTSNINNIEPRNNTEAKPKSKAKKFKIVQIIFLIIFLICLVALLLLGIQYLIQRANNENLANDVVQYSQEDMNGGDLAKMTIDWTRLREESPDVVAWITVPNTIINYPVVQGADNDYYLRRSYDGTKSWATTGGTIFLDSSNSNDFSDKNNVMYGHHMNDGSMFAEIAGWENQDKFNANRTIYVLTPTMNYRLTTFANVVTTGTDAIIQTKFSSADRFTQYVQDKITRSVVDAEALVRNDGKVAENVPDAANIGKMFMLVTCEYSRNDGRACVCAYVAEQAVPIS